MAVQTQPRYGAPAILEIADVGDPTAALLRQRRRLGSLLATLTEDQWATPSRCEGWSVQDVVAHLAGTDQFWTLSFEAGLRGEPTRFLANFDPVATPAQMVDAVRDQSPGEVLKRYEDNVGALEAVVANLDADQWSLPVEAPPGHIALRAAALHAPWDAWTHERDIVIPLGLAPVEEPDEVGLALRYVAGLGAAFSALGGAPRPTTLSVRTTDPPLSIVVVAGTSVRVSDGMAEGPRLSGPAIDLLEGLSRRAPLAHDLATEDEWILTGLAQAFDQR